MIEKIILTTEGKLRVAIPSKPHEVTLGMLIAMQEYSSDVEIISILSGRALDDLYLVRNITEFDVFSEHVLSLVHQIQYDCENMQIPNTIIVAGKKVQITRNLSIEPYGPFIECRNIIADEINEHRHLYGDKEWDAYFEENKKIPISFNPTLKSAAMILAHYLYCHATGLPYDDEKVEQFKDDHILKLSMTITMPIAKYFFLSYPNLWKPKTSYLRVIQQTWKRKVASKRLRRTPTLIQLIHWLMVTLLSGMK